MDESGYTLGTVGGIFVMLYSSGRGLVCQRMARLLKVMQLWMSR
jgi:hypothetical protein